MNKIYDPGDVKIISISLTNYNRSAKKDIRGQVISCSIYEDMEQPSLYCELLMKDGVNLVKDFPIIGEEELEIAFVTPHRTNMTIYKFRTYSVTGTSADPSNQSSTYTLLATSQEHLNNSINLVDKSYKDTVSGVVSNILKDELATEKNLYVEETRGILPITMPKMAPFKAIDYLRQKAVSTSPTGGVFVFFENQFGFNFASIESLIEKGKSEVGSKVFTHAPDTKSDKVRQTYNYRNIIQLNQLGKFDTVDKLAGGMFKNVSRSYDILTKNVEDVEFNISEQGSKFVYSDKKSGVPATNKIISEALRGSPNYIYSPKDSSKGDDFVSDLIGYRTAFIKMFNQAVTRCLVYGDNYLSVGDLIELRLPDTSGTTNKKNNDSRYSGYYLITKLRHILVYEDSKFKHQIVFDCNRAGISE